MNSNKWSQIMIHNKIRIPFPEKVIPPFKSCILFYLQQKDAYLYMLIKSPSRNSIIEKVSFTEFDLSERSYT